jgi:hypothetical protein
MNRLETLGQRLKIIHGDRSAYIAKGLVARNGCCLHI